MPGRAAVDGHLDGADAPPASAAVPVTVTGDPAATVAPPAGEVIDVEGACASADAAAALSPGSSEPGCAPMSASRLTVACFIEASGAGVPRSWSESSPHDHCTVPAPNTSASGPAPFVSR